MPRFYFDFYQGDDRCPDAEGSVFVNVEQAYLEAYHGAQEMWSELLKQRRDPRRCMFEVRNAERELLFIFPFQEIMDNCQDLKTPSLRRTFDDICATANYANRVTNDFQRELQSTRAILQQSQALLLEGS